MSQIPDVGDWSAAHAIKPNPPSPSHTMSDAMLADEHRGRSFALDRAKDQLKAVEAELERRGLGRDGGVRGALSLTTRHESPGLIDLKRLRAELAPEIWMPFVLPGTGHVWRSRTLSPREKADTGKSAP